MLWWVGISLGYITLGGWILYDQWVKATRAAPISKQIAEKYSDL